MDASDTTTPSTTSTPTPTIEDLGRVSVKMLTDELLRRGVTVETPEDDDDDDGWDFEPDLNHHNIIEARHRLQGGEDSEALHYLFLGLGHDFWRLEELSEQLKSC